MNKTKKNQPITSFSEAIIILMIMLIILGGAIIGFKLPPQVPILVCICLLCFWANFCNFNWAFINQGIQKGVSVAVIPIFIFILIGSLIGLWIKAGIIPSIMYFGFHSLSGSFFVPSVFLACSIVGAAIGSGLTTISTLGIALFGIGASMHANMPLVAGAIISGGVFGDKMSPISDSTNLASAVAGSELFAHIKNMTWSTVPAFLVSLFLYWILGSAGHINNSVILKTSTVLSQNFIISWWTLLPLFLIVICAWRKVPSIPTLFINIAATIIIIFIKNPHENVKELVQIITTGFVAKTASPSVNALLTRGGINSMMGTVFMVISTLSLGELLIEFGIINSALNPLIKHLHKPGSLILTTILSGIGVNLVVGAQYLSVILPGEAFKDSFNKMGLSPLALSRVLEDGGTVINYIIPWGVSAMFVSTTLGIPVIQFMPFVFFSLLSPVFSVISGFTGIGLKVRNGRRNLG